MNINIAELVIQQIVGTVWLSHHEHNSTFPFLFSLSANHYRPSFNALTDQILYGAAKRPIMELEHDLTLW